MIRNCDVCKKEYNADERNVKRGWGLCCSKSCAAKKREMSKPGYSPERVKRNNVRRELWWDDSNADDYRGHFKGYTSEGYRVYGTTAYDEFDDPVYDISMHDMTAHPHDLDY